jgi:hypothetical protein
LISPGFRFEREVLVHFHNHEHARSEQINLHIFDTRVLDALEDLGPDVLVMTFVFRNQFGVVFQIKREAETSLHWASSGVRRSGAPLLAIDEGRYPRIAK